MEPLQRALIDRKIEELRELAQKTESPMLVFFHEAAVPEGFHVAAYGTGDAMKNLLIKSAEQNQGIKAVLQSVAVHFNW